MIGVFAPLARATEPEPPAPAPAPETIELEAVDDLPSAVDGLDAAHEELRLAPGVEDWRALPGNLVRGKLFVRPVLGAETLAGHGGAARVGGALGHRWWTLAPLPVSLGGEERLELTAPFGSASGRRLAAAIVAGPWVGPIGLRVGPTASWERARWGDRALDDALVGGFRADLSASGGPFAATVGVEPGWRVAGERPPAADPTLPVLGDQTTWRLGLGWLGQPIGVTLDGEARETALGTVLGLTLGLHLNLL